MNLLEVLTSKPHNIHYVNRYIKFIESCKLANETFYGYTEQHHICPKAKDLFPEYADTKLYKWNMVNLSSHQHILAHVILWKAFGNSQGMALDCMLGNFNSDTNKSRLVERKVPESLKIRYLAKMRDVAAIERVKYVTGKTTYVDKDGKHYFLEIGSSLIQELNLTHFKSGSTHSDIAKERMSATKYPNKRVSIYNLSAETTVGLFSDEFDEYINQGWSTMKSKEDYEFLQTGADNQASIFWTNRMRYMDSSGTYHGSYLKDDPIISKLNLVPLRTQNQIDQNLSRTALSTLANTGSTIYNNGEREEKFKSDPGPEWTKGRLPRTEAHLKAQKDANLKACLGTETWNDGKRNYPVKPGDIIPDHWVKGMRPQGARKYWYTDTKIAIQIEFGSHIPDGFTKITNKLAKEFNK